MFGWSDDVSDFTDAGKALPIGSRNISQVIYVTPAVLRLLRSPFRHTLRERFFKAVASHPEFPVRHFPTNVSFTTAWRLIYLREIYSLSHVIHQTISSFSPSLCWPLVIDILVSFGFGMIVRCRVGTRKPKRMAFLEAVRPFLRPLGRSSGRQATMWSYTFICLPTLLSDTLCCIAKGVDTPCLKSTQVVSKGYNKQLNKQGNVRLGFHCY